MNFRESSFIETKSEELLARGLPIVNFMCKHCNRIKISTDLVRELAELKAFAGDNFNVILGYQCKELCEEIGDNPNNSHTNGVAADISFNEAYPLLDILDKAAQIFPFVGLVKVFTGEYYLHVQHDITRLYWLCAKMEDSSKDEYIYFKDYQALRKFIVEHPDIFGGVKI